MVRSLIADETHGRVAVVPLADPAGPRFITPLACERVHVAAGRGVCLTIGAEGIRTVYAAEVFDPSFQVRGRFALTGVPSRVRVSPDGQRAGITVFEQGHSYAEQGYSTRTTLLDTARAGEIAHLESFAVTRDGQPISDPRCSRNGSPTGPTSDGAAVSRPGRWGRMPLPRSRRAAST